MNQCKNILVVDDEKINIAYVSKVLEDNYTIKVAHNGKQALNILNKITIDLVLLDIQMPIMNGFETIQQIKNNSILKNIPVIFLTSSKDDDTLAKVFKLGASDYISKPFNQSELKVRVENHLNNYFLQKELQIKIKQINSILNEQNNIVILSDGLSIEFANKMFFEFLGCENLEEFDLKYNSICEVFIQNDKFFHKGKIKENQNWIESILQLSSSKKIVSIVSINNEIHSFSVNINNYEEDKYIITFTDISDTILNQIELENKIIQDKLTSSYNREYFEQNYKRLIDLYNTSNTTLSIVMLDLDNFKKVNDTYGHNIGDDVLIHFVQIVNKYSRNEDILIRWGGEEFILVLKVYSKTDLEKVLENLRKAIENEVFLVINKQTCSMGASLYKNNEEIQNTIKRADEALYKAKTSGKNKVIIKE